jgi:hypothetical protein
MFLPDGLTLNILDKIGFIKVFNMFIPRAKVGHEFAV